MNSDDVQSRLALAREAERAGEYERAELHCREALEVSTTSTSTIDAFLLLGTVQMRRAKFDEALQSLERALSSAVESGSAHAEARSYAAIGYTLRNRGDLQGAISNLEMAWDMMQRLNDDSLRLRILANLGSAYAQAKDLPKAMSMMKEGAEIAQRLQDHAAYATIIGNIGNIYSELSDYQDALSFYHLALTEHERLGMTPEVARDLMNIGLVSLEVHDHDAALEHFNRALEAMESMGEIATVAEILVGIGSTYMELGDKESALQSLRRAYDLYVSMGATQTAAHVQSNIGIVLRETSDFQGALECFNKALDVLHVDGQPNDLADVYQSLGVLYYTDGFELKDNGTAENYLQKAVMINTELGRKKPLYECHQNLSKLYRSIGDDKKFMHHFVLYHELESEVQTGNAQREAYLFERQREVERHEREVREVRLEQELAVKDRELAEAQAEIYRLEKVEIARQKDLLEDAYGRLRSAFREVTMLRIDKKARLLVMSITVILFIFSDSVIDPTIYRLTSPLHTSMTLTYAVKIIVVLLLKPLEDLAATVISKRQRDRIERDIENIRSGR